MEPIDIISLLGKNEIEHFEFKKAESTFDFDKLVEYSIALANECSGMIVLGVTDKKPHRIAGNSAYLDDLVKIKERLIVQVHLRIDVEEVRCAEGRVLVFHKPAAHSLLDAGLLERAEKRGAKPRILSRKLYSVIGKSGVHTRKQGLDKETNKELLLKHISNCEPAGATMSEFLQVLPALNRRMIQTLLTSLVKDRKIYNLGPTRSARWHVESQEKP
jgi:predicted HTH transcriptional regulator